MFDNFSDVRRVARNANVALFVLFVVAISIIAFFSYQEYQQDSEIRINREIEHIQFNVKSTFDRMYLLIKEETSSLIFNNKPVLTAFKDGDRKRLLDLSRPIYDHWKKLNLGLERVHFHKNDGTSFLRVHKPDEYGDSIANKRPMVAHIHMDKKELIGFEVGQHGLFYRVIQPLFFNNRYLGAIEIGVSVEFVLDSISRQEVPTTYFISHEAMVMEYYQSSMDSLLENEQGYLKLEQKSNLFNQVSKMDFGKRRNDYNINGHQYAIVQSMPLANCYNQNIGHLVSIFDLTDLIEREKTLYYKLVMAFSILFAFGTSLVFVLFRYFEKEFKAINGRLEQKVDEVTRSLREKNKEIEAIFNVIEDPIRVIDLEFNIVRANKAFCSMARLSVNNVVGKKCFNILPGESCHTEKCPALLVQKSGIIDVEEIERQTTDGTSVYCLKETIPLRNENEEIVFLLEHFKDLTYIQKIEEEKRKNLEKMYKTSKREALATIASGLAHEINNPLALVAGAFLLIKREISRAKIPGEDLFEKIDKGLARIQSLVQAIRFHQESLDEQEPIKLLDVLSSVINRIQDKFIFDNDQLEVHNSFEECTVLFNEAKIYQIFYQIIENAFYAISTCNQGKVKVVLKNTGSTLIFAVEDNGIGMPKDMTDRIFDEFFSGWAHRHQKGIGLSMVRAFVEASGGVVGLDSEPGKGTKFSVTLPCSFIKENPIG